MATRFRRSVAPANGTADTWSDPGESALLAASLASAGERAQIRLVPEAGHDLAEASDELIGELAGHLATRLLPRDLPPLLVAIEGRGWGRIPA